jgi:hypothetical protein
MEFAPVGIYTYTRLNHLEKTIESLKRNTRARDTELFVFSDGPRPGDEIKVENLRSYLKGVTGFKRLHVVAQGTNDMFKNIIGSQHFLSENYSKYILMEDDIVTSPHFLDFMNEALVKYEFDKRVMSIGGYCPPIRFPKNYKQDTFFAQIFCPWGLGMWADRFRQIISSLDFTEPTLNRFLQIELKFRGKNLLRRFKALPQRPLIESDLLSTYDLVATALMLKSGMHTLLPRKTMVKNIGLDETGLHCSVNDSRFSENVDEDFKPTELPSKTEIDHRIVGEMYLLQSFSKPKTRLMNNFYLMTRKLDYLMGKIRQPS